MIELMPIVKLYLGCALIALGVAMMIYGFIKIWMERNG